MFDHSFDRRRILKAGAFGAAALAFAPRMAFAAADTDQRFVFIIQRGAADGLGTLAPVGDPAFAGLRGDLAADFATGTKLDGMFTLHPSLQTMAGLYKNGEALFVHATGTPYVDRSHFDGQNVLETGGVSAYQVHDGWMNRMVGLVPGNEARAIAVAAALPLAMRGSHEIPSYAPSSLPQASDDLLNRVTMLYQGDQQLHALWTDALSTRQLTSDLGANNGANAAQTGALAARLLGPAQGARIAMIETGGWDTHTGQRGRLGQQLKGLDAMVTALKTGLGPAWNNTVVLVATEFGRTAAANGTQGTDHGTGSLAMLLGGGVRGGRVMADWPGLAQAQLNEGRDLKTTTPLDAVIAGAVAEHYRVDPGKVAPALFPTSSNIAAIQGLARA